MIIKFLAFLIFCGIAPGNSIFLSYQLPKLLGILGIILIGISEDGLMKFFRNIRDSKALYFLGILWLEIIWHKNFRGIEGTININDGLFFWLTMTCLYASLTMLSSKQKRELRSGLIFSCFFCVGVIFFHAITEINMFGYAKLLTGKSDYGYMFYSWSDHLSISIVSVLFFLIKAEWQKIIILYSLALIHAKSSVFLGLLTIKNIKIRIVTGIFLIFLMILYGNGLMIKETRNASGERINKVEALTKINSSNQDKNYFGILTTGRIYLWKTNLKFHLKNVMKNAEKLLIGNGSQGILREHTRKIPAKAHLLPLDLIISHGLIGVIFYWKFCFNFFGIFGNLILLIWYHSLEFSGILIICYNLRLTAYQFPGIPAIINSVSRANNIFNISIRKR